MTTWTEFLALAVVHSSSAALSHFGVTLEPAQTVQPLAVERVVARTPREPQKLLTCPAPRAPVPSQRV
jgi:hypothetical protein